MTQFMFMFIAIVCLQNIKVWKSISYFRRKKVRCYNIIQCIIDITFNYFWVVTTIYLVWRTERFFLSLCSGDNNDWLMLLFLRLSVAAACCTCCSLFSIARRVVYYYVTLFTNSFFLSFFLSYLDICCAKLSLFTPHSSNDWINLVLVLSAVRACQCKPFEKKI